MGDVTSVDLDKPIIIPEAKMAAPGDYKMQPVEINLLGRKHKIDLIKQVISGNCAEYTVLDSAIIAQQAGLVVNDHILDFLDQGKNLNLDQIETELIVPFIRLARPKHRNEIPLASADETNLENKISDPYQPLTITNSAILFRDSLSSDNPIPIKQEDVITSENDIQRTLINELVAYFIGSSGHATSLLKLSDRYLYIDPFFNPNIVHELSRSDAEDLLRKAVKQEGSFITANPLLVAAK